MQPVPSSLPPKYGAPISLEAAKCVMAAAEQEALANQWPMVIAIVDSGGHLVMLRTLDHAQHGSIAVAQHKAETAANFKRSTKVLEETVAGGGLGLRLLSVGGMCAGRRPSFAGRRRGCWRYRCIGYECNPGWSGCCRGC